MYDWPPAVTLGCVIVTFSPGVPGLVGGGDAGGLELVLADNPYCFRVLVLTPVVPVSGMRTFHLTLAEYNGLVGICTPPKVIV